MRGQIPEFIKKIGSIPLQELTLSLQTITHIHLTGIEKYSKKTHI